VSVLIPRDSLVAAQGRDFCWTGTFETDIAELGIRAVAWDVEENEGGNRADLMLADWWAESRRTSERSDG
jgi:hypothetical protein